MIDISRAVWQQVIWLRKKAEEHLDRWRRTGNATEFSSYSECREESNKFIESLQSPAELAKEIQDIPV